MVTVCHGITVCMWRHAQNSQRDILDRSVRFKRDQRPRARGERLGRRSEQALGGISMFADATFDELTL